MVGEENLSLLSSQFFDWFSNEIEDPGAFHISSDHIRYDSGHGPSLAAEIQIYPVIPHTLKKNFTLVSLL